MNAVSDEGAAVAAMDSARIRELAQGLNVLTDDDFALLAGVKPSTTEAWRKRGTGPSYVLLGNRYFYPRVVKGVYKAGGTRLAIETGAPVIPVAVTSAKCWPRKAGQRQDPLALVLHDDRSHLLHDRSESGQSGVGGNP